MTARGHLLEQYARPRRGSPNYLGWARVDAEPGASGRVPVRWINETNFNKYYRKVQE